MMGPIAISGSTGLVGKALLRALDETGLQGRGLSRKNGGPDLGTATADDWARRLDGCAGYVHLAALLPSAAKALRTDAEAAFETINVCGAVKAMEGFAKAGGRHFVFLSSAGLHGAVTQDAPLREDMPLIGAGPYLSSKQRAEDALGEVADRTGVELTVLRPPAIYGAGAGEMVGRMISWVAAGRRIPVPTKENRRDMIGADNIADLIGALLKSNVTGTYLCRDRETVSTRELVTEIGNALGRPARFVSIPHIIAGPASHIPKVGGLLSRVLGNYEIDDSRLLKSCDWTPRHSMARQLSALTTLCSK